MSQSCPVIEATVNLDCYVDDLGLSKFEHIILL